MSLNETEKKDFKKFDLFKKIVFIDLSPKTKNGHTGQGGKR